MKNQEKNKEKEWQCTGCKIDISEEQVNALPCDICNKWSCRTCLQMPEEAFNWIKENMDAHPFICQSCSPKVAEIKELLELKNITHDLQTKVDAVEKQQKLDKDRFEAMALQIKDLTDALKKQNKDFTTLSDTVSEAKVKALNIEDFPDLLATNHPANLLQMITTKVQPTLKPLINNQITERDQIFAMKKHLVISGMPENTVDQEDSVKFTQMIKDEMDLIVEVESVERIPRKPESASTQPKLLRVVLKDMKIRKAILSKATSLRNSSNEYIKNNIYIRPELTKLQMEESKNLTTLLRAKRTENPGKKYKIYRGEIIETTPQPIVTPQD